MACTVIAGTGNAREILVDAGGSGDYSTVQEGAAAARPGDVVTIFPGVYREDRWKPYRPARTVAAIHVAAIRRPGKAQCLVDPA